MEPDHRGHGAGPPDPLVTELRPLLATSPSAGATSPPTPLEAAHLLYEALVAEDLALFSTLLSGPASQPAAVNHCHGDDFTCLQYACEQNLAEFVKLLLAAGADPAAASPVSGRTALHWAAARGAPQTISRLLERDPSLDVSAADATGVTPLQLAVQSGDSAAMLALLRAGADVCAPAEARRPLLHAVPADVLEEFLDGCVRSNGRYVTNRDYCLRLDFSIMWPRRPAARPGFETAALFHMSTSREHRYLLRHPLVESFIDLKWWQVRPFFMVDLLYYALFLALLTVLVVQRTQRRDLTGLHSQSPWRDLTGLHSVTVAVMIPLLVGKSTQLLVTLDRCILSDKNGLLKVPLLLMTAVYLGMEMDRGSRLQLSAMMMLLAWMELFALLSRVPAFSIYPSMLRTVFWRYVSFVFWYLALILGLMFSTYIMLFKECSGGRWYQAVAFLRPFIMTMDKVDIKSLPINSEASLSQLLFIALFFIMTVALTNLVNGLAVTDITHMRKNSRISNLVARVHLLAYTESFMLDESCEFLGQRRCRLSCGRLPVPFFNWAHKVRVWLAKGLGLRLRLRLPERRLCLYVNRAVPAAALTMAPTILTEPPLPRFWRFSVERLAAARRLAMQPTPRASLAYRISRLETQLSTEPDHKV